MITVWAAHQRCEDDNDHIDDKQFSTAQQDAATKVRTSMMKIGTMQQRQSRH